MLPERYRRLWRRRLRRRPLLPFLLAATVAVDVVGLVATWDSAFFYGVAGGQLALLGLWITRTPRMIWVRLLVGFSLLLVAMAADDALATDALRQPRYHYLNLAAYLTPAFFASFFASVVGSAVTRLMSRAWGLRPPLRRRVGIGSLLATTTLIALALAFGRYGVWDQLLRPLTLAYLLAEAVAPAVALLVAHLGPNLPMRLGAYATLAAVSLAVLANYGFPWLGLYYVTQALFAGGFLLALEPPRTTPQPLEQTHKSQETPGPIDLTA